MSDSSEKKISVLAIIISVLAVIITMSQTCNSNKIAKDSAIIAYNSYSLALDQIRYEVKKDSINASEELKKWKAEFDIAENRFQHNLDLAESQINALMAITDYNKQSQRPFFSGGIYLKGIGDNNLFQTDEVGFDITADFLNSGRRPATELTIDFVFVDIGLENVSKFEKSVFSPNDIPAQQRFIQEYRVGHFKPTDDLDNIEGFYLYAKAIYKDPILKNKKYEQRFYFKWVGIKNGKTHKEFTSPFKEEILQLNKLLSKSELL